MELHQSTEARMTQLADAVTELFPDARPEQQLSVVITGAYLLRLLTDAGAVHLSTCLYRAGDGAGDGFTQGVLAVFIDGQGWPDRGAVARRTAMQWAAVTPDAEIAVAEAPYGPVAIRAFEEQIAVPGFMYGLPEDQPPTTVRRLECAVPLLPGDRTALFVFMTEDDQNWNDYLSIVMGIVGALSSEDPDETEQTVAELEGA
ncbi:hypothetical protein O7599_19185 [Streptomyces sp. WMMC500]|uniref:hypothetical protein n=1 Tax=Streptomyces sp. WMMC500 TaxID=3015154 RepID=UPI00248B118F|nr:hypothetical protein [Streptomyces sp. WMMC500]WBB57806.1 hypothetical protein O7599_19185 [Streptomyces sp. WMMC500]